MFDWEDLTGFDWEDLTGLRHPRTDHLNQFVLVRP